MPPPIPIFFLSDKWGSFSSSFMYVHCAVCSQLHCRLLTCRDQLFHFLCSLLQYCSHTRNALCMNEPVEIKMTACPFIGFMLLFLLCDGTVYHKLVEGTENGSVFSFHSAGTMQNSILACLFDGLDNISTLGVLLCS